jgi:hypothetical protein
MCGGFGIFIPPWRWLKMSNEPKAMREIHEIRERMYEEEKNLSTEELVIKIHNAAEEFKRKYGLKFKKAANAR